MYILECFIDWILRILGISAFIGIFCKAKFSKYYIDNVKIISIDSLDDIEKKIKSVTESRILNDGLNKFIIFPDKIDILQLKFFTLTEDGHKDTLIEEIPIIQESHAFSFEITLIGTVPHNKIEWKTSLGEKGEFVFNMNGYNGNIDMTSYKYKLSLKGLLFKIFNIY